MVGTDRRTSSAHGRRPADPCSFQDAEGVGLKLALGSVESWILQGRRPADRCSFQDAESMGLKLALGSVESWILQRVNALDKLDFWSL